MTMDTADAAPGARAARTAPAALPAAAFVAAVIALLALQVVLTLVPIRTLDPAGDEVLHIGAAYHYALTGSDDLNREHPTLMKRLAAFALSRRADPGTLLAPERRTLDQDSLGTELLFRTPAGAQVLVDARMPFLFAGLGLTLVVLAWSRTVAGPAPALAAAALVALSPMVHALGGLVVTDLLLALFALAAAASTHAAIERRSPAWSAVAGVACALAAHSKYPGVLVAGFVFGAQALAVLVLRGERRRMLATLLAGEAAAVAVFLLLLDDGGYAAYLRGFAKMGTNYVDVYQYWMMGTAVEGRRIAYFPFAMLVKSTPAELVAAVAFIPVSAWLALRGRPWLALALAAWPVGYLLALSVGAQNMGHRYTMPLYGFFAVALAILVARLRTRPALLLAAGIAAAQLAAAVVATPDPLSYFNGLAGCGGRNGYRCLDDSNIDWGQNLSRVEAELARRGIPRELMVFDIPFDHAPDVVLPGVRRMIRRDWHAPSPVVYAVSAHMFVRRLVEDPMIPDTPMYAELGRADYFGSHFIVDLRRRAPAEPEPAGSGPIQ